MSSFFLDLTDRVQVLDFLAEILPYLSGESVVRVRAESVVRAVDAGEKVSREALADLARTVARAAWVPRVAVEHYVRSRAGAEEEWCRIAAAVSNSTEHLLERFRFGTGAKTIEEVLGHEESPLAFGDAERMEIAEVRKHVLPLLWAEKRSEMREEIAEAEQQLDSIEKRLAELRTLAVDEPMAPEGEIMAKVAVLEDRLYYAGEELDPKQIAVEVASYRERIALPEEES